MTAPSPSEIAAVAGKLTKAQREALTDAMPAIISDTFWFRANRGIGALHRKGLADYCQAPARLTPLGVAVRQHLIAQGEG